MTEMMNSLRLACCCQSFLFFFFFLLFPVSVLKENLSHQCGGSGGLVLEVRGDLLGGSVVSSQPVDSGLDKNESELRVLVLSVLLQVLSDVDGLLDQEVKILRDLWGQAVSLEDSQDLAACDATDLRDTVGVTKNDADLRRGVSLLRELADVLGDFLSSDLQPSWGTSLVRKSAGAHTFSFAVHTTHVCFFLFFFLLFFLFFRLTHNVVVEHDQK